MTLTFGSLFTGAAGIDLGLEAAGMECRWQVESNRKCNELLEREYPNVTRYGDFRTVDFDSLERVDVIAGGDPCPIRSRARSNGESRHPDLAGYFLALVGRMRPRWVVRENVLAPDDVDFVTALELLGYGTAIVRTNAATFTAQKRERDFIVGGYQVSRAGVRQVLSVCENGAGDRDTGCKTRPIIPTLTTNPKRYDSCDCYVWEQPGRLRILDGDERDAFAGFPQGWTSQFTEGVRAKMAGNAAVRNVVEPIARCLARAGV